MCNTYLIDSKISLSEYRIGLNTVKIKYNFNNSTIFGDPEKLKTVPFYETMY
jgi:hypothetical protein